MITQTDRTPRLLGVAFLFVLVASALGSVLSGASAGTGDIASVLANVAHHPMLYRISILTELATAVGIVVLAVLLYEVLAVHHRLLARVALGLWLAEAVVLAVSQVGADATLLVGDRYTAATALGDALYNGVEQSGYAIHFLFYCAGAVLWFLLFHLAGLVPRWLTVWGLVAETVALIGSIVVLSGVEVNILAFAHIAVLELAIGLRLVVRGVGAASQGQAARAIPRP
jgi:hypothetical protein